MANLSNLDSGITFQAIKNLSNLDSASTSPQLPAALSNLDAGIMPGTQQISGESISGSTIKGEQITGATVTGEF